MWDHALAVLSSIVVIIVGSVIATYVLRRFEGTRFPFFSFRFKQRHWDAPVRARSWMGIILYLTGIVLLICGCLVVIPTMSRIGQVGDLILLLGTPMVMNGITLVFYGIIVLALGKIVDLLSRPPSGHLVTPQSTMSPDRSIESESKVLVACPNCGKQMRIPAGNTGTMKCPRCATGFNIGQAVI